MKRITDEPIGEFVYKDHVVRTFRRGLRRYLLIGGSEFPIKSTQIPLTEAVKIIDELGE